jgi:hypothetical protein
VPRYFLNLTDGRQVVEDPEGLELAGEAAAREEAAVLARDLVQHQEGDWSGWSVAILDESGQQIELVPVVESGDPV